MKDRLLRLLKEIYPYIIIILIVVIIRIFIITPVTVDGPSMNETLHNGEVLLLKKFDKSFDRYDVVVFIKKGKTNEKLIKRILALPGEKIKCVSGIIYVNNEEIDDSHAFGKTNDFSEVIVGDDEYFVVGDNREISYDSRYFGPIKKENIQGVADFRLFPFNKFGNF